MVGRRLLFLGDSLPYPADRGTALRSYHVLRLLASRYEVDALFFHHRDDPTQMPLRDRVRHLQELATVEVFPAPGERSGWRRFHDRTLSRLLRRPITRWRYDSADFRRRILELRLERDPRIVHVDRITLHRYLPLLESDTVVLTHHRVESEVLLRSAGLAHGAERRFLERQARWMEETERYWLPRVALNVASSEHDRAALAELAPEAPLEAWPDGVDVRHFTPGRSTGKGLAYVGGATRARDRDALDHFATRILPRLRSISGIQALEPITWVGSATEADRRRYRELGIDLTGYVEDIRPVVRPAACYVVPTRIAGGARFKVLLAWAMGKAVVSTSAGCQGLDAVDGENILIRDDPDAFARAVVEVLEDRDLRARLGDAGRRTVEENYSWDLIGDDMLARYQALETARA